jgi:hypothetical protein
MRWKFLVTFTYLMLIYMASSTQSQNNSTSPQDKKILATNALRLFEAKCDCHDGIKGQKSGTPPFDFRDRTTWVASDHKRIVAGDVTASSVIMRINGGDANHEVMPPKSQKRDPLGSGDIKTLTEWISAGAPNLPQVVPSPLTDERMIELMVEDLDKNVDAERRRNIRYLTLTNLYNSGVSEDDLALYRFGNNSAPHEGGLNHLS